MGDAPKLRPVKTSFLKINDVPNFYATSAWALDTADDGLILKFFIDSNIAPAETHQPLQEDGQVSPKVIMIPDPSKTEQYEIIREFQCGVVMSKKTVRIVHDLLSRIIEAQDKSKK